MTTVRVMPEDWEATLFHAMMRTHRWTPTCVDCASLTTLHAVMKGLAYEVTPEVADAIRTASPVAEGLTATLTVRETQYATGGNAAPPVAEAAERMDGVIPVCGVCGSPYHRSVHNYKSVHFTHPFTPAQPEAVA